MRRPYTQLYLHCVWATWDRLPLITSTVEARLYAYIVGKCRELECETLAIGGIADHIHLLVRVPPTLDVAKLMKEVKGASSHLMAHELAPGIFFKWQGAYGAFTLSKNSLSTAATYIRNQKAHHAANQLLEEWETCETSDEET